MSAKGRAPKMTDSEIVELLETTDEWAGRPFTHTTELEERTDMTRQGLRQRLEKLVKEREEIKRHKPSRDVIYWIS